MNFRESIVENVRFAPDFPRSYLDDGLHLSLAGRKVVVRELRLALSHIEVALPGAIE